MKVLTFDQATNTGWTLGDDQIRSKDWISGRFQAPKRPEIGQRLLIVFKSVCSLAEKYQPDVIGYEEVYDPIRELVETVRKQATGELINEVRTYNPATIAFLHQVCGTVQTAAAQCAIPTEGYMPRQWRATLKLPSPPAELEGAKRSKWVKRATLEKVRAIGAKVRTEDEANSWGIAYHMITGKPSISRGQADLTSMLEDTL